jgi:hypothetical protein
MPKQLKRKKADEQLQVVPHSVIKSVNDIEWCVLKSKDPEPFMGYYTQHFFIDVTEDTPPAIPISAPFRVGDKNTAAIGFEAVLSFDWADRGYQLRELKALEHEGSINSSEFFANLAELPTQLSVTLQKNESEHIRKIGKCIVPIKDEEYGNISLSIRSDQHGESLCHVIDQNNKWVMKYGALVKTLADSGALKKGALVKGFLRMGRIVCDAAYTKATVKLDVDLMKIDTSGKVYPATKGSESTSTTIMTGKKMVEATKEEGVAMAIMQVL